MTTATLALIGLIPLGGAALALACARYALGSVWPS